VIRQVEVFLLWNQLFSITTRRNSHES